jgi:hypothetical protein
VFDENGYVLHDAENATLGNSDLGISKTNGWDISCENAQEDAHVTSNGAGTQAIFYKGLGGANYYEFEFDLDASLVGDGVGKAGAIIYNNSVNYMMFTYVIDPETYDSVAKKFLKASPCVISTDKDGIPVYKKLNSIDVSSVGTIKTNIVFSNSYVFVIMNGELIHCEFVADLNERTNPGLCTIDGGVNVRFTDYKARVLTAEEEKEM